MEEEITKISILRLTGDIRIGN